MFRRSISGTIAAGATALVVLSAAPAGAVTPRPVPPPPDRAAALQAALDAVHEAGMPGLLAEVRDGATTWRGATGVADVTSGAPMRPWFEHRIGSLTKTFVATALLQLVGEGRLGLDDPVGRYVGDLLPADLATQVTVRMLLQHTSGIGDYPVALLRSLDDLERYRTETLSPQRLVALGLALPRANAPGAGFFYSNTNYILAGLIIEKVTGRPVEAEVAGRITLPLGLVHTYFPGTYPYIIGPHSRGYVPWTDGSLRDFSVYNMSWAWTAGAIISTMSDLNGFYAALLSGRLLRPDLLAEMLAVVPENPADPTGTGYGLGIVRYRTTCGAAWGHGGGGLGYGTQTLRAADGTREVSVADNMTLYEPAGTVGPIDVALNRFLLLALCGTTGAGAARRLFPPDAGPSTP
jgi:D-alanyl-D-alanine carboxypeptidase